MKQKHLTVSFSIFFFFVNLLVFAAVTTYRIHYTYCMYLAFSFLQY